MIRPVIYRAEQLSYVSSLWICLLLSQTDATDFVVLLLSPWAAHRYVFSVAHQVYHTISG